MFKQLIKRFSKVPPPVAIIAVLIAIVAASGAALLLSRSEPKAQALVAPRAARIERVEGSVGLAHSLKPNSDDQSEWDAAAVNAPLTVGDRIYARENSHAAIAFTGRNYARLDPGASLDVLSLADRRTQLALRGGSAIFDVGELADSELFEVATPNGAVDFNEPGLYQVGIGDNGNTIISVLSGLAQVVGVEGSGQISKGEILTLVGQAATQALLSKLTPNLAGNIVDDYYDYRYPNTYDGRYSDYDTYLDDPYYYDQYRQSASYSYLPEEIPGLYDLDRYGDWANVDGYGQCWTPRVDASWAPYRSGYWDVNDLWGPTWVAEEPWGWAPYHYGRWAHANNQRWVWVPEDCRTNPVYAPALVAFVPLQQSNQIAWAPLAPGERYLPRYYDANFQPRYFASREVVTEVAQGQRSYANFNYPTAVTVIPVQEFRRRIDREAIIPANVQLIAQSQAVTDPFAVDSLRQIAMKDEFTGRRIKMPRGARRESFDTPVVTSIAPAVPPVIADQAQALRVEPVTEKQRKNKLKFNDSGQVVAARRPDGLPQAFAERAMPAVNQERQQRMTALAAQAQQGDKTARSELRALKREQRKEERAAQDLTQQQAAAQQAAIQQDQSRQQQKQLEREQRMAVPQAQGDQTREQRKAQKQLERQQREVTQQSEQHNQQDQIQRAQRQADAQSQINQQREQMKAQRKAERQQRTMMEGQNRQAEARQAAQQAQMNQAREARKAQRQAEAGRAQQMQQQQQINQQREQMKAQRRAERQQAAQQQQMQQRKQMIQIQQVEKHQQARQQQMQQQQQVQQQQMQQQREQMKAQRRAERQQAAQPTREPALLGPPARQNQPDQGQRKGGRRKP